MALKLSERTHPLFEDNLSKWNMYKDSALGGDSFINDTYLMSHRLEDAEDYTERLDRAYFLNFCDTIPSLFNSFIFREKIERPADPDLDTFRTNIDQKGSSISEFVKRAGYYSSIFGSIHALVDTPYFEKGKYSKRDVKENGIYPYASLIFPHQLRDWSLDRQGNFRWVIIEQVYYSDADPNIERDEQLHYKLITRDKWKVEDDKGNAATYDDGAPNSGPNALGIVPLVTMYHKDIDDNKVGESMLKDIVFINRAILNWCSCIDEQIERQTFSQLIIPDDGSSDDNDDTGDPLRQLSTSSIWTFPSESRHPPAFISPNTDNISVIWSLVLDHIKEIFRLSGLQGGTSDLTTAKSGRQSQMSFIGVNSCLAEKAMKYGKFENELSKIAYLFTNKDPSNYIPVIYPSNFNTVSVNEEINTYFQIMEKNFSVTLNKSLMKTIARRSVPTAPYDVQKTIEDEIEAHSGVIEVTAVGEEEAAPEKDGQGNTNTNLGDTSKSTDDLHKEVVGKHKKE